MIPSDLKLSDAELNYIKDRAANILIESQNSDRIQAILDALINVIYLKGYIPQIIPTVFKTKFVEEYRHIMNADSKTIINAFLYKMGTETTFVERTNMNDKWELPKSSEYKQEPKKPWVM